jgi:uncharacterized membrane protein required for colicin V production
MIAALTQSLSTDNLPVNWFDAAILIVLGFGVFRGRKNGMTKELIPLFQWIIIVVAAGLGYSLLADVYNTSCGIKSKLWSALAAYFSIAMAVFIIFSIIKKVLQPKLTGSGIFGSAEYYLGMISGPIRYFCMLIFALALINAKHYTAAEVAATKAYNQRWYGGGIYSGDYMPDLHSLQDAIFKNSFTGKYLGDYLGMFLIQTGPDAPGGGGSPEKKTQPVIHIGN